MECARIAAAVCDQRQQGTATMQERICAASESAFLFPDASRGLSSQRADADALLTDFHLSRNTTERLRKRESSVAGPHDTRACTHWIHAVRAQDYHKATLHFQIETLNLSCSYLLPSPPDSIDQGRTAEANDLRTPVIWCSVGP